MMTLLFLLSVVIFLLSLLYIRVPQYRFFWWCHILITEFSVFFLLALIFSTVLTVFSFDGSVLGYSILLLNLFSLVQVSKPTRELLKWQSRLKKNPPYFLEQPNFRINWLGLFSFSSAFPCKRKTYQVNPEEGVELLVDFLFAEEGNRPLIVNIHGGAWKHGTRTQVDAYNRWLCSLNYNVATISYRLLPEYKWPTHFNDVQFVMRDLLKRKDELKFDSSKIVISGRSAGGHLALLAAYRQVIPNIKGIINFYGITDMNQFWQEGSPGDILDTPNLLKELLGSNPQESQEAYLEASPTFYVQKKLESRSDGVQAVPTLSLHGKIDPMVSWNQAESLAKKLREEDVDHYNLIFDYTTHGFEFNLNGPGGQPSRYMVEHFLKHKLG